ncbi:LemA family protein [Mycoplasmopsis felis]|uniref:LemA family protein n=1 Tax=Mycoplasmopsis felis TaxID=33923 RepID=UPI002AF6BF3F|nr:LemA family protein [Mycoplasmopsis felis]WQQ01609.1 LemA family protein [Mycoplasmopsis felis]
MSNLINTSKPSNPEGFQPNVDNSEKKASASTASKVFFWLIGLVIFSLIYYFVKRNRFNQLQFKVNNAASSIDVILNQRYDTLTKLVNQVKSYKEFEKETLSDITKMRALTLQGGIANANELEKLNSSVFGRLMAVSESYPELQSSSLYKELMNQSTYLERELQAARRTYNSYVNQFNEILFTFPSSIVASMLNLETLPLFVASATQKQDVSMANL